jgi:hypothetical protein
MHAAHRASGGGEGFLLELDEVPPDVLGGPAAFVNYPNNPTARSRPRLSGAHRRPVPRHGSCSLTTTRIATSPSTTRGAEHLRDPARVIAVEFFCLKTFPRPAGAWLARGPARIRRVLTKVKS